MISNAFTSNQECPNQEKLNIAIQMFIGILKMNVSFSLKSASLDICKRFDKEKPELFKKVKT